MAVINSLMVETIEEGLNEVFYDSFNMEQLPNVAMLGDVFKEKGSRKHQEYDLEVRGVGRFKTEDNIAGMRDEPIIVMEVGSISPKCTNPG